MARIVAAILLLASLCISSGCGQGVRAESVPRVEPSEQRFDDLIKKYPDLTFQQLSAETPQRDYLQKLSFDPSTAKFYDETVERLQLTEREQEMLRGQGLVSVDHDQRYSFGSLYHASISRSSGGAISTTRGSTHCELCQ